MERIIEKLHVLDVYLEKKHHLRLYQAMGYEKEEDYEKEIKDKEKIGQPFIEKAASIFYLDPSFLTDDEKELPHEDSIQVDEVLIALKQGEYANNVGKRKNKDFIKRNYKALDKKGKKKLWINLALTVAPFMAFILYSIINISVNRAETLEDYRNGDSLSTSQKAIEDSLYTNDDEHRHYATVNVGTIMESINSISSANSSYNTTMTARFDFSQLDYHKMWWEKEKGLKWNQGYYSENELSADNWSFNADESSWMPYADNIPDVIQFNFEDGVEYAHLFEDDGSVKTPSSISTLYLAERKAYPGEKTSNVFTDKNDEFSIGNGKISADSLEYLDRGTAYRKDGEYRYSQKLHFSATINKTFDSPRYPLDSAQFHVYLQPSRNSSYIRYVADKSMSGFTTYFNITDGYKLIKESDDIKRMSVKLNYYQEIDRDPYSDTFGQEVIKTQFEVIVRANKQGLTVFLNSFLNIIAVGIWLTLAFYNQTYNKDDSISMIGTGFFSAISAILLGFSMVSNANFFSMLSIVNIFTLGMVLVMGYESISVRRAQKLGDVSTLAYRNVRMRVLFYFLALSSIVMYLLLPTIAYFWML